MTGIDIPKILELAPSPAYVIDLGRLRRNLAILDEVQRRSGAKILMALKAFAMWSVFPIIRETLQGVCASSPWEARLGREEFGGEVHSFAAAFKESDVVELLGQELGGVAEHRFRAIRAESKCLLEGEVGLLNHALVFWRAGLGIAHAPQVHPRL